MATERTVLVRLRADAGPFSREMVKARAAVAGLREDIDTTNDRTAWMAQGILAVGPAAVTMGATAVPVLAGLATHATVGTAAIGTMLLAFNGVGDALKALNEYQVEPTAKNLEKLDEAMAVLGTDGEMFVRVLDQVGEKLSVLGRDARAGMFPGMADGLKSLLSRLPQLRTIVTQIAEGVGQLSADAGRGLAGSGFDEFFEFLETDAKPILIDTGRALGNFVQGFASLLVDFAPLTRSFTGGLLDMSRRFADWAEGLDDTRGFQEFLQYIKDNGPDVMQLFGALGNAVVEIAKAAAPVGTILVPALETLADVVAMLADTPVGSLLILGGALTSLYGRVVALRSIAGGPVFGAMTKDLTDSVKAAKKSVPSLRDFGVATVYAAHSQKALEIGLRSQSKAAQESSKRAIEARESVTKFGKAAAPAAAGAGLLVAAMSPLPEKLGLTNTVMGAMAGMMLGPWGAAAGATVGLFMDLSASADEYAASQKRVSDALSSGNVDQINAALEEQRKNLTNAMDSDEITGVGDFFSDMWRGINGRGDQDEREEARENINTLESALARAKTTSRELQREDAARKWARQTGDAFVNLAADMKKPELTLDGLIKRMRDQGRAAVEYGRNLRAAIRNGADPEALQKLIDELGPQAGLALQQLAAGGKKSAREFNAAWGVAERGLGQVEGAILRVDELIARLPDGTTIRVTAEIRSAQTAIQKIKDEVAGIKDKSVRVNVFLNRLGAYNRNLGGGRDGDPSTPYATGGFTGWGAEDEEAGVVHGREVVIPADRVAQDAPFLISRYGDLPGMDQLGAASRASSTGTTPRITTTSAPTVEARAVRDTAVALKSLAREAKASEKSLSKLRSRRENLLSARDDLRSSVSEGLQSDLWSSDAWSSSDPLSILRGDIRNAKAFRAGANTLRDKGVTGAALAEILRSGDLSRVQQMASMTKGQLTEYRQLFNERAREVGISAGRTGALVYGPALDRLDRRLGRIEAAVKHGSKKNSDEHKADRDAQRRGAGNASSRRNRGYIP